MPTDNMQDGGQPTQASATTAPAQNHSTMYLLVMLAAAIVIMGGIYFLVRTPADSAMMQDANDGMQQDAATNGQADVNAQLDAAMPADSSADFMAIDESINQL